MISLLVYVLFYLCLHLGVPVHTTDPGLMEAQVGVDTRALPGKNKASQGLMEAQVGVDTRALPGKKKASSGLIKAQVGVDSSALPGKNKTYPNGTSSHFYKRSLFPCPVLSPSATTPTSVHRLRPADIKVIAALGDSLTAGHGATGELADLHIDSRGLSWSIGGDGDYFKMVTLPNILRQYNSKLYGYSEGTGSNRSRLNMAVSGSGFEHLLQQAKSLVQLLKNNKHITYSQDWKLITISVGENDLCVWCKNKVKFSAANYSSNLEATLNYLLANVPRTFVNLVEVLNVDVISKLDTIPACELYQQFCPCASNTETPEDRTELIKLRKEYQEVTRQLVLSGRYDKSNDFTVVLQPFYENTSVPLTETGKPDMTYFASDCFHFSKKSHVAAATALWNNMIEPVGSKRTTWTPGEVIKCPTETLPYLRTAKNS